MKTIVIYNGFYSISGGYSVLAIQRARSNRGLLRLLPYADALGILASTLCLVHCMVVPVLVSLVPAVAPQIMHDDRTHYILAFFVTAFCLMAVLPGYLRHSRKPVLLLMVLGLGLVLFATFLSGYCPGEHFEITLITAGNLCVVGAHYLNRRLLACSH